MSKKQMNYDYMYKGKKSSSAGGAGAGKYTPGMVGKIAMAITAPSAVLSFISVIIALFGMTEVLIVTFITLIISFIGSIVLVVDIVIFNRKQRKKYKDTESPKELDIMRIVHMVIGIFVGIIIGYLIWGNSSAMR